MVELQLYRRGIADERVLAAMGRVPRELFVPAEVREAAYADAALPIGDCDRHGVRVHRGRGGVDDGGDICGGQRGRVERGGREGVKRHARPARLEREQGERGGESQDESRWHGVRQSKAFRLFIAAAN